MLTGHELLEIKGRMLLAAEAAARLTGDEPLELDVQTHELVSQALLALREDTRAVLAEVDILRGMVTGDFDSLFGVASHGRDRPVERVQQEEVGTGGSGEQPVEAGVSSPVRSERPDGEAASRPRAKRNRRRRCIDPSGVDTGG